MSIVVGSEWPDTDCILIYQTRFTCLKITESGHSRCKLPGHSEKISSAYHRWEVWVTRYIKASSNNMLYSTPSLKCMRLEWSSMYVQLGNELGTLAWLKCIASILMLKNVQKISCVACSKASWLFIPLSP